VAVGGFHGFVSDRHFGPAPISRRNCRPGRSFPAGAELAGGFDLHMAHRGGLSGRGSSTAADAPRSARRHLSTLPRLSAGSIIIIVFN
jgi:hypothetical protein